MIINLRQIFSPIPKQDNDVIRGNFSIDGTPWLVRNDYYVRGIPNSNK